MSWRVAHGGRDSRRELGARGVPVGRRTRWARLATAVVPLVVVAGCSSSPQVTPAPTRGVTGEQVTIGATAPLTGPLSGGASEVEQAIGAYFAYVNAKGGVHGRKIVYDVEDDRGDPSRAAALTTQLVNQQGIFADVGPTGPTSLGAVASVLDKAGVPAVFMGNGCSCWNSPSLPLTFGWQPPSVSEGKILGQYLAQHDPGAPFAYVSGADPASQDGLAGLTSELPRSHLVVHQTTPVDQFAAAPEVVDAVRSLVSAGARVVVLQTSPTATAELIMGAAAQGYHPQWALFSDSGDTTLLHSLMSSDPQAPQLLGGIVATGFLPPATDTTNAWVSAFRSILAKEDAGAPWDGAAEYGMALGYTFVEAVVTAGRDLTRSGLVQAIEDRGAGFAGPGLVPLTYSANDHFGYQGSQVVVFDPGGASVTPVTPPLVTSTGGTVAPVRPDTALPPAGLGE
jgi:branched-chain amino acid transport system substrate-binding protein